MKIEEKEELALEALASTPEKMVTTNVYYVDRDLYSVYESLLSKGKIKIYSNPEDPEDLYFALIQD